MSDRLIEAWMDANGAWNISLECCIYADLIASPISNVR